MTSEAAIPNGGSRFSLLDRGSFPIGSRQFPYAIATVSLLDRDSFPIGFWESAYGQVAPPELLTSSTRRESDEGML